jgi:hypothetical protein
MKFTQVSSPVATWFQSSLTMVTCRTRGLKITLRDMEACVCETRVLTFLGPPRSNLGILTEPVLSAMQGYKPTWHALTRPF